MLLARLGRPEVSNCIAGLKQYNYAYEEAGEEAVQMESIYAAALNNESDLNHMASVVQAGQQHAHSDAQHQQHEQSMGMTLDQTYVGMGNNGQDAHVGFFEIL